MMYGLCMCVYVGLCEVLLSLLNCVCMLFVNYCAMLSGIFFVLLLVCVFFACVRAFCL